MSTKEPDKRQVTIRSARPTLVVTAWLGLTPPKVTGGYGGWTTVPRPRRQAITSWQGHEPFTMDLPILLDGYINNASVEARCTALERMARPPQILDEPPIVTIDGSVPHSDLTWVINAISWDDTFYSTTGQRIRQYATISLLRYVADDRVQQGTAASRARSKAAVVGSKSGTSGIPTPWVVKQGDTLQYIALMRLKDYKRWTEIAKLNKIRDPKTIKVGDRLRIPK